MSPRARTVRAFVAFALLLLAPRSFAAPPVVRTFDNGLRVAVWSDPRLPVLQIQVLVPAGSTQEKPRERGAARITAALLTLGTTSRDAAQFTTEVERLGGTVAASASLEYATLSGSFRAADLELAMELMADATIRPLFGDDEIANALADALQTVARSRQILGLVADEHVSARVFPGHPYGVPELGTLESVAGLGREQVQGFHRECYRPDRALLAIAGNVDAERVFALAEEHFGDWKGRARATPIPAPGGPAGPGIRLVDVPGATRAEIRLGLIAPGRNAPDALALDVANDLLGIGPASRLNAGTSGRTLRAYSTLALHREAGMLVLATAADNDSVPGMIDRMRGELRRFVAEPPSEGEVAASRRTLGRSFPIDNEGLISQVGQWLSAAFHGFSDDFADRHPERIQAVTVEDVRAVAARWFDADHAELVVVGAASAFEPALARMGKVEVVPLAAPAVQTAPSPAMDLSPPGVEALERGKALAARALAAHGGAARLRGIKDSDVASEVVLYGRGQTITGTQREQRREPWQLRIESTFRHVVAIQALNGRQAWSAAGAQADSILDADSLGVAEMRAVFLGDPLHVLLACTETGTRLAWRGEDEIGVRPTDVVEMVTAGEQRRVLFFDRETHHLVAMEDNQGSPLAGPALRRLFGEYRSQQGILWPHFEERLLNGERTLTLKTTQVRFNTGLAGAVFERPGQVTGGHRRR